MVSNYLEEITRQMLKLTITEEIPLILKKRLEAVDKLLGNAGRGLLNYDVIALIIYDYQRDLYIERDPLLKETSKCT